MKPKTVVIVNYPAALKSAVFGFSEIFEMANKLAKEANLPELNVTISDINSLPDDNINFILLPPSLQSDFTRQPTAEFIEWLKYTHKNGAILCSACSGVFLLGSAGLLKNRSVTTHWGLAAQFNLKFPDIDLDINKIIINDGDIITAGGLMSWVDLGLEIVAIIFSASVMRLLGKQLVVDTGYREQRYYQYFIPNLSHGDKIILTLQQALQVNYAQATKVSDMARFCNLTERTFLRRFVKATQLKPTHYLQKIRVQKACDLLETSNQTFEHITFSLGYDNVSAFRKVFVKIMGITPSTFRKRFMKEC